MKPYTGNGDKGKTSLLGGKRVNKNYSRVEAVGVIDELNAYLGIVISKVTYEDMRLDLLKIQTDLFLLSSNLSLEDRDTQTRELFQLSRISSEHTEKIEKMISLYDSELPPIKNFIKFNKVTLSCQFNYLRTICRRAERKVVGIKATVPIIRYLNRLSSLFWVMARTITIRNKKDEELWVTKK